MTEQAKAARREYKRNWAAANRDKIAEYQNRYWERKAETKQTQREGKKDEAQRT